ncbi:class I SAM-dependent methyltransferase [Intrasporangium sp.]|uniref:class I SAM-dependent DNA methyltransferase n=1 Tax=Intrasporangium sp. TaxID=1925024 RepID=UPI00336552B5
MGTEHFDDKAATWDDDPEKVRQAQDVARAVSSAVPLGDATRLLEYGAGTALVTQALLASAGKIGGVTLADNSPGMRARLSDKVSSGVMPPDTRVWDLDLENEPAPSERFDLIVSSMVMHHVHQLPTVLEAFAELLADGGHLCIADLDREDGSFHTHDFDGHHGFDRGDLATALQQAGLADVTIRDCTHIIRDGVTYPVFLAIARGGGSATLAGG